MEQAAALETNKTKQMKRRHVHSRSDEEFHTGTVQMKVECNQDTESDDEQVGNQNHDVPYNSNNGHSLTKQKSVSLY